MGQGVPPERPDSLDTLAFLLGVSCGCLIGGFFVLGVYLL